MIIKNTNVAPQPINFCQGFVNQLGIKHLPPSKKRLYNKITMVWAALETTGRLGTRYLSPFDQIPSHGRGVPCNVLTTDVYIFAVCLPSDVSK